jgi:hypothetical protein
LFPVQEDKRETMPERDARADARRLTRKKVTLIGQKEIN